jgi:hypothetical protein
MQLSCEPQYFVVKMGVMRQYVVDQLRYHDYEKLKGFLDQCYGQAAMGCVYWIPLDREILSAVQSEHGECQPHVAALELEETRLSLELLVRTPHRIRCNCIAYATHEQREWLIRRVDDMLEQLDISV